MDSRSHRAVEVQSQARVAGAAALGCALLAVVLAGCTGSGSPSLIAGSVSHSGSGAGSSGAAVGAGGTSPASGSGPSVLTGSAPNRPAPSSSGKGGASGSGGHSSSAPGGKPGSAPTAVVAAPYDTNPSGVICNYVSQSAVAAILPGSGRGQENDIDLSAVSYCAFANSDKGTLTVGVKRLGGAAEASERVHGGYTQMAAEPDQSTTTFTAAGGFAFEVGSTTPLQNGSTLYALNAQGSRGSWYVNIQCYARRSISTNGMQSLLNSVLAKVPNS